MYSPLHTQMIRTQQEQIAARRRSTRLEAAYDRYLSANPRACR